MLPVRQWLIASHSELCAQVGLLKGMRADAMHRLAAAAADSSKQPYRVVRIDTDTDSVVPHTVWGTMRVPAYVTPNVRLIQNTQKIPVTAAAYC
jgi:hypothetical protein